MTSISEAAPSKRHIDEALQDCAAEQVHTPGTVQPFGCLVCVEAETSRITYVSANSRDFLGQDVTELLGKNFQDMFGSEVSHALNNAFASNHLASKSMGLGVFDFAGKGLVVSASASGNTFVVQFEAQQDPELGGGNALTALSFLMQEIQSCEDQASLLSLTTELLRHLTGYDRVMVYRFDPSFNGEVIAEARNRVMEPFLGLHFPNADIPPQARAMMKKIPLRIIEDVDQSPVPLLAMGDDLPVLDISLAECRGVSPVHMQYLRNMGIKSTMTLNVLIDGALWGMISFHHRKPRVPAFQIRELLMAVHGFFCGKLSLLRKQAQLDLTHKIDSLKDETLGAIDAAESTTELASAGPVILEAMQIDGLAVMTGSAVKRFGKIPDQSVLDHLAKIAHDTGARPIMIESFSVDYPEFLDACHGIAGALVVADGPGRTMFLFREERAATVSWAGNPDKTIDLTTGAARLSPRASFSQYLEEVKGKSLPWTKDELFVAERVWTLINSAERLELRNRLEKQKDLMIDELNHRVRNILTLVRSVSRQARRHNSSLESYSKSIEKRIHALAAAHDLASGQVHSAVSMTDLIAIELEPYEKGRRVSLTGKGGFLRPDIAPIFSLVIHELVTNAAKYGAISVDQGRISIKLEDVKGGITLKWRESGGPEVVAPNERGFGSTLIEQAVPYEMGGTAELRFPPTGVEADFFVPSELLDLEPSQNAQTSFKAPLGQPSAFAETFEPSSLDGLFLVVEDNYTIAKDMRDQLADAGIKDIEICSNNGDALELLAQETPAFAMLDVNLGPAKTSEPIALSLLAKKVPFIFATGYGEKAYLTSDLAHVPILTKPTSTREILGAMSALLGKPDR